MPAEPQIAEPKYPVYQLTTSELTRYRRELEHAVTGISPEAPGHTSCAAGLTWCWPSRASAQRSPAMGESDAEYMATLTGRELNDYRETLEWTLAQAELPKLSRPREELQAQLAAVVAVQAERTGSGDARP